MRNDSELTDLLSHTLIFSHFQGNKTKWPRIIRKQSGLVIGTDMMEWELGILEERY